MIVFNKCPNKQTNIHNQEPDPQFTQRFIDAIGSVKAYNERHTGIGGAMRGLAAMMMANVADKAEQPKVSLAEEAEMEKQLVQLIQTDELGEMGVTLFDTQDAGIKEADLSDEKADERPSSLVMLITDGDKFKDTLYKLNPTAEQREEAAGGVATLLSSAVSLVQAFYPHRDPEDSGEAVPPEEAQAAVDRQLDLFMELNPALVGQGFANSGAYKMLSEYAARYASGTLPEYREAEAQGLLYETGYGPAQWVSDANAEQLEKKWTAAFDLLKGIRDREEPSPFFSELFGKLRADFDTAKHWLDTVPTYGGEHDQAYAAWEKEAAAFRAELDKQDLGFEDRISAGAKAPRPPKPPKGSVPADYVAELKKEMNALASEWEKSFTLENASYLSERADDKDAPKQGE